MQDHRAPHLTQTQLEFPLADSLAGLFGLASWQGAHRQLSQMDDRLLDDIGLTRGEIADAVRYGREAR